MSSRKGCPNHDWSFLPATGVPGQVGVYVARDANSDVLYVGFTRDLRRRMAKGHRARSSWFSHMASVDFIPCDGLTEARLLEKALIAKYRPAGNVKYIAPIRVPRRQLPSEAVARLVELHEAYADAHLWHREAETAALAEYINDLNDAGWTFASIGYALDMTRQATQAFMARWNATADVRSGAA